MKQYKINEIFYSIQGEGYFTGTPAIFVRFSGCNLKCPWCDTKHEEGTLYTKEQLEAIVDKILKDKNTQDVLIVLTGGEPTLQISDEERLFNEFFVAIETNGTNKVPRWVNWITVSPKSNIMPSDFKFKPNEIKLVYEKHREEYYKSLKGSDAFLYLQPLELDGKMNTEETVNFVKENPEYRLSVQLHKFIGVR